MEEKMFKKEKNNLPAIIVSCITVSLLSSGLTYSLLSKNMKKNDNNVNTNIKYEIEKTDSPVVAIAAKTSPSIVGIRVNYITQGIFGLSESGSEGSGVIYKEDGYIITNCHVISEGLKNSTATIKVTFNDGSEEEATVIGYDKVSDLAVIKVNKKGLKPIEIGNSKDTKVGELAVAIGNPLGQEFAGTVTVGYVSAVDRKLTIDGRTFDMIQTDAAINSGNSGGALVNSEGKLIGINTAKVGASGVEGLGFSIPVDKAITVIDTLIKDGKIARPYIGIMGFNIDNKTAEKYNLLEGVYIQEVMLASPAAKSGFKVGDVIIGINGKDIKTMEELNNEKNKLKVGDKISLKVYRNSKKIDIELVLEEDLAK